MKKLLSALIIFIAGSTLLRAQTQVDLPVTFDDPNVSYSLTDFGGNISSITVDPVVSTNSVCKIIKPSYAEL